ncbi:hypothetical protein PFISCL1PPCAC_16723, partial [Pristionchus fissidentatus]
TLEFGEIKPIEDHLWPLQASEGTVFYVHNVGSSIYVLDKGKKVIAIKSWDGEINYFRCFADALYFSTRANKIYKATFDPPGKIQTTFIRDLKNGETLHAFMLISRKINGKEV